MKLCKNCKHFKIVHGSAECTRGAHEINLITGYTIPDYYGCIYERYYGYVLARLLGKCGKEGRFYEENK